MFILEVNMFSYCSFPPLFLFVSRKHDIYFNASFPVQPWEVAMDVYQFSITYWKVLQLSLHLLLVKGFREKPEKVKYVKFTFCIWFGLQRTSSGVISKEKEGGRNIIIY